MSASPDFDASEYDLGTTSVRLIRAGSVVQAIFSSKLDAKLLYDREESGAARTKPQRRAAA
jgi:hypothetical protein